MTSTIATPLIAFGVNILIAVLVLAGGIAFFVVGRGRGALAGAGFVVLAVGTAAGSLLNAFGPVFLDDLDLTAQDFSTIYAITDLLFDLVGWGLVIAAIVVLARTGPARAAPGPAPGPPHGHAPHGPPPGQAPHG